ncbi:MAG: response regulator [Pseudomonadota bacterium]
MKRILIIDDSKSLRDTVRSMLALIDIEIMEADDGSTGLSVLKQEQGNIDLILLDWYMPTLNGYDFLVQLRAHDQLKSIPVVMLTTAAEKEKMIEAIRAGATHYLTKPFTPEDLLSRVVQILGMV